MQPRYTLAASFGKWLVGRSLKSWVRTNGVWLIFFEKKSTRGFRLENVLQSVWRARKLIHTVRHYFSLTGGSLNSLWSLREVLSTTECSARSRQKWMVFIMFHRVSLISIEFHGFQWIFINFSENIAYCKVFRVHFWRRRDLNMLGQHFSVTSGTVGTHWKCIMMTEGHCCKHNDFRNF